MTDIEIIRGNTGETAATSPYSDDDLEALLADQGGDVNLASAIVWEWKAAALAGKFDFSADGGSYQQSQAFEHCKKQAASYRSRRQAGTIELIKYPAEGRNAHIQ